MGGRGCGPGPVVRGREVWAGPCGGRQDPDGGSWVAPVLGRAGVGPDKGLARTGPGAGRAWVARDLGRTGPGWTGPGPDRA
ncbi:hypothetical protein JCM4814A_71490 [Streptomyces phaeofaciens JCM 4814]|uniref:Uncharacterized protein n=1 Tax=Streptomyces phaeofaciens TaxID=68254 RepID=A0A918LWW8_9ACTN|nr:hypothetical protein GCM10010226_43960 [Streptomyces phaeofaciens]